MSLVVYPFEATQVGAYGEGGILLGTQAFSRNPLTYRPRHVIFDVSHEGGDSRMLEAGVKEGPVYLIAEDAFGDPTILMEYPSREVAETAGPGEVEHPTEDYLTRYLHPVRDVRYDDHLQDAERAFLEWECEALADEIRAIREQLGE